MPALIRILDKVIKRCPGTGRIIGLQYRNPFLVWCLPLIGLIALVWYLLRVIPKPGRASYPCQRVAAPLASGFLAWIAGIGALAFFYRKARQSLKNARMCAALLFFLAAGAVFVWTALHTGTPSYASETDGLPFGFPGVFKSLSRGAAQRVLIDETHDPLGTGAGVNSGRVVWVHDPDATNENCPNTGGDYWWQDGNTDQLTVDDMFSESLRRLTGADSDSLAWASMFRHFNRRRNRGDTGYVAGEKIAIKVNLSSGYTLLQKRNQYTKGPNDPINMVDTSPQMMRALLRHLTAVAGVAPADICIGDPMRPFFAQFFDMLHEEFPGVVYLDPWGADGRTKTVPTAAAAMVLSGKRNGQTVSYKLPQQFVNATYTINLGVLKGHEGAGITLCAKNHFGTHAFSCLSNCYNQTELSAFLHFGLPAAGFGGQEGMSTYRNLVDIMGHEDLDGKGLLFIVDGLWGAHRSTGVPNKWKSFPFNDDWPSCILVSQDEVALESVGFDLLRNEYHTDNGYPDTICFPNIIDGTEDYLHQAADPANWPDGIVYDPEGDGTPLTSLGVHEHWNNATEKKYRRNLDSTEEGIELIAVAADQIGTRRRSDPLLRRFDLRKESGPGNASIRLVMEIPATSRATVVLFGMAGRRVATLVDRALAPGRHTIELTARGAGVPAGRYICRMQAKTFSKAISLHLVR